MFLEASPPRLTQRSRLDDWLLLLMRVTIITLIALAFMRPFFRTTTLLNQASLVGRQVVVLIDRSASMQREGTWTKAIELAKKSLRELRPQDDFSLVVFDATPKYLLGFERDRRSSTLEEKRQAAFSLLDAERPGWNSTDLATALTEVVETLSIATDESATGKSARIILISDMQNGAVIEPLQTFEWPDNVIVDVQYTSVRQLGNANLRVLNEVASAKKRRVRVTNYSGNEVANFQLVWRNSKDLTSLSNNEPVRVDVVAGTSRTEELEIPADGLFDSINLAGDQTSFDNTFYMVPRVERAKRVAFLGGDKPDDPDGLLYYLTRALPQTTKIEHVLPETDWTWEPQSPVDLVVVAAPVSAKTAEQLKAHLQASGTVLAFFDSAEIAASLKMLSDNIKIKVKPTTSANTESEAPKDSQFRLLVDLDFRHPLLEPFSSPQFNDFSKIHFWKTSHVDVPTESVRMLARFDNSQPAVWELPLGTGRLIGLATSWRPVDSQLALSSKFVPLLTQLLELNFTQSETESSLRIGQNWQVPAVNGTRAGKILRPDGQEDILTEDSLVYSQCDVPGIYTAKIADTTIQFAVNLSASESDLEPVPIERLQALGIRVGKSPSAEQELLQTQRLQDMEIESRQKFWKWLIASALGLIILETAYAAWKQRRTTLQPLGVNAQ